MAGQTPGSLESVLPLYFSLDQEDHCGSVGLLGDLLIANARALDLHLHAGQYYKVLVHYADSLYFDLQFRKALHTYQQALMVSHQQKVGLGQTSELLQSEYDVKWRMYKCHIKLKEKQEAFDMLCSIPMEQRDSKMALALGRLQHHFKNNSQEAKICYKQALRLSPLALEAAISLLNLGMTLTEVCHVARSLHTGQESGPLSPGTWLYSWLEFQGLTARHEFSGAVSKLNAMTQEGFTVSAATQCQLARCKAKLGQTDSALELFVGACAMDPYVLTHMDTYSRLLSSKFELEKLSTNLLYSSCHHPEPWLAKAWQLVKSSDLQLDKVKPLIQKAESIESRNAETIFLQGTLLQKKNDVKGAVKKFIEVVQIDPTFFEAFEYMVRNYLSMGCDKEALSILRVTAKKLPTSQQLFLEGLALSRQNTAKAKHSMEHAIRTEQSFEKAALELSKLFTAEGNPERAIEILTNQVKIKESAVVYCELGSLFCKQDQLIEAEEHFRQALRLDSSSKKAREGVMTIFRTRDYKTENFDGENMGSNESMPDLDLSAELYDQEWIG